MHKILEKRQLSADVFYMKVEATNIAHNRKPGQFVIVQIEKKSKTMVIQEFYLEAQFTMEIRL